MTKASIDVAKPLGIAVHDRRHRRQGQACELEGVEADLATSGSFASPTTAMKVEAILIYTYRSWPRNVSRSKSVALCSPRR